MKDDLWGLVFEGVPGQGVWRTPKASFISAQGNALGLEFGHFLPNTLAGVNPQGCQKVAGGRSLFALNDHRKSGVREQAPRMGCQTRRCRACWRV
jgi:hypothetical protein